LGYIFSPSETAMLLKRVSALSSEIFKIEVIDGNVVIGFSMLVQLHIGGIGQRDPIEAII
jgi:hypothetical protein